MAKLLEELDRVHIILKEYVSIHDHIFTPSVRKMTRIPGLFKAINFNQFSDKLEILANDLKEIVFSGEFEEHPSVFRKYATILLRTIQSLRLLCIRLNSMTVGTTYNMEEYKSDVSAYENLVTEYREIGFELNHHLLNIRMTGGMVKRPKSWMLINHAFHIIAGLLLPNTFIWTTSGIWVAVLLSVVTQGIDQFRLYLHYQKEFQLIDQVHEIKEGRSTAYKNDQLWRHGQTFIIAIIWYGLVTMITAGFMR